MYLIPYFTDNLRIKAKAPHAIPQKLHDNLLFLVIKKQQFCQLYEMYDILHIILNQNIPILNYQADSIKEFPFFFMHFDFLRTSGPRMKS
jgi:hypothetical protein